MGDDTSAKPAVLFINKTAKSKSLSQSSSLERTQIYSHVQRSSYSQLPRDSSPVPGHFQSPKDWTAASSSRAINPDDHNPSRGSPAQPGRSDNSKSLPPVQTVVPAPSAAPANPRRELAIGNPDPFLSLALPLTPYMHHLLQIYSNDIVSRLFPIKPMAVMSRKYTMALARQDPLYCQSLLSTVANALYGSSGDTRHKVASMAFKGNALTLLNKSIAAPEKGKISSSCLHAISLLMWIGCLSGDLDDLKAHTAGLQHVLARTDDFAGSHISVLASVQACSYLTSAILDLPPMMRPLVSCERSQLSAAAKAAMEVVYQADFRGPAHRFLSRPNQDLLGPQLARIVAEQQQLVLLKMHVSVSEVEPTHDDLMYVYATETAVEFQLLALHFDSTISPVQDAVRLALFLYPMQPIILVSASSAAFSRAMATKLRETLQRSDLSRCWAPSCDLLLFVLFIGSYMSRHEAEWDFFRSRTLRVIGLLDLQSQDELEHLLRGFYFWRECMGETLELVWSEYERAAQEADPLHSLELLV